ncbi:MAG: FtsW/RodA/SpoVE family cell cycle protein [Bacteroidetes bacterium]|nr:FtsW/RodA/SpoVE family cell cycle protein [Bacteroidota bacterium]MDA0888837.1 FtsW/RodA/SpoVE family cell cycle protein [Bacteroidota bacterium]MDA1084600.1 FtsW/RodA/SpoVE family cell cycle protein [Bacteroidota bacterium]
MKLRQYLQGDKSIWGIVVLLSIFSFLPVYSASSNLVYVVGSGSVFGHLLKHIAIVCVGWVIMYAVHLMPFRYFSGLAKIGIPIVVILLAITALQGTTIDGANASRWLNIPIIGMSFQTSTLATVVLLAYVADYFATKRELKIRFTDSILPLWLPVFIVVGLILPANLSTALLLLFMVAVVAFLGGYPLKYLLGMLGVAILGLVIFILLAKAYPDAFPNRVDTWMSRIDSFSGNGTSTTDYQIERAKAAVAVGGIVGIGAGKSMMKNVLPQSSSDFIYAIIAEEYGMIGALFLLFLFLLLLFRILINANKSESFFGQLLILAMGIPIVMQAFINMGVAVALLPVTGQPLPLISSGGTSLWMTFLAIGIILSVSANRKAAIHENESNPLTALSNEA